MFLVCQLPYTRLPVLTPELLRKTGGKKASGLLAIPWKNRISKDKILIMYYCLVHVYKQQLAAFNASLKIARLRFTTCTFWIHTGINHPIWKFTEPLWCTLDHWISGLLIIDKWISQSYSRLSSGSAIY